MPNLKRRLKRQQRPSDHRAKRRAGDRRVTIDCPKCHGKVGIPVDVYQTGVESDPDKQLTTWQIKNGVSHSHGKSRESIMLANLAASIVVGKLGTAVISGAELRRAAQHEVGSARGVLNREQLATVIADAKSHGEKVVFTKAWAFLFSPARRARKSSSEIPSKMGSVRGWTGKSASWDQENPSAQDSR